MNNKTSSQHNETSCLELLYQDKKTLLHDRIAKRNILLLLASLLSEMTKSLEDFYIKKHLRNFDPHVGETSCQIRAYKLALLDKNTTGLTTRTIETKIKDINELIHRITTINKEYSSNNVFAKTITLSDLLIILETNITFNNDEIFLFRSYLLTKYKKNILLNDTVIDYEKLCTSLNIKRKQAKKLVRHNQLKLSEHSSHFIFHLLEEINDLPHHKHILPLLNYRDDNFRSVLPCYEFTKVLLKHLSQMAIPIAFIIEHVLANNIIEISQYIYDPQTNSSTYLNPNIEIYSADERPCLVIKGISTLYDKHSMVQEHYSRKFSGLGAQNIVLANMAKHPQYSGKKLTEHKDNPYKQLRQTSAYPDKELQLLESELLHMQELANIHGCSVECPALFCARHVYCDKLSTMVNPTLS